MTSNRTAAAAFAVSAVWAWFGAAPDAAAQVVLHEVPGASPGEFFGWGISFAGDVDQDGCTDFLSGAPLADTAAGADSGRVTVFSGRDGSVLRIAIGPGPDCWLGKTASDCGDVDADGIPDFIGAAPRDDSPTLQDCGSAVVHSGATGALLYRKFGEATFDELGWAVTGVGDVDHDGHADFAASSAVNGTGGPGAGCIFVFRGSDGSLLYKLPGDSANDRLGMASDCGDVDNDGFPDLIGGARWDDDGGADAGSARVYSGFDGSTLFTVHGDAAGDGLGASVGGAGDMNHDGFDDFIAGIWKADWNGPESGAARIYSGFDASQLRFFKGASAGDGFGDFVHGAGDVDGDGTPDVIIGAFQDDEVAVNVGSIHVMSGATGSELFAAFGAGAGDELGVMVGGGGDADGNGFADVLSGAYWNDQAGSNAGIAYVWSGCSGAVAIHGQGCAGSGGYVPSLRMDGCPLPGATVTVRLEDALGGAPALLLAGTGTLPSPPLGCNLLVSPLSILAPLPPLPGVGPGAGSLAFPVALPASAPPVTLAMQVLVADAASFKGFTATNAVRFTIGS